MDGEALTFGNQGALFKNAMTWWDHETRSIWSQPWGTAISGELKGTALGLIPASVVPWSTWRAEHPDTTVVSNDLDRRLYVAITGRDDFVVGVALEQWATAYYYKQAADLRVINDRIGAHPVAVFVDSETRDIKVYLRRRAAGPVSSPELRFEIDGSGRVVDTQTASVWDTTRGVAIEGPLKGTALQQLPYITSFDWAWLDFFPHTTFYED